MKIKTSTLTGPTLDWAVSSLEIKRLPHRYLAPHQFLALRKEGRFNFSENWTQGGPIIERELIALSPYLYTDDAWQATLATPNKHYCAYGPTPLIAAMRCFVASKLGDEVEVPNELS